LTQILEDSGIEVFSYEVGDAFDPQRQKVVSKVDSDNPELNKTIARTIGEGYSYSGRTLSAQKVDVYSYNKPTIKDNQQEKEEDNG
jgi:molecular chaperone GrpE (heat shock protein)